MITPGNDAVWVVMKVQNKIKFSAFLVAVSGSALALDPTAIDVKGMYFVPMVELAEAFDDNLRASDVAVEGWVTSVKPSFMLGFEGKKGLYELNYSLERQINHVSGISDLTNQLANATAKLDFDMRNKLDLSAGYSKSENIDNYNVASGSSKLNTLNFGGLYVYGAESASGNVELGFDRIQLRSEDDLNLGLEYDSSALKAAFIYRVSPRTRLLAEIKGSQYDYISNNLDSTNVAMLVGARWEATAKTTGSVKFGRETKSFDTTGFKDATLSNWEVSVNWSPLTYSVITLNTKQKIDEGSFGFNSVNSRVNGISWQHAWASGISSQLALTNSSREYSSVRTDVLNSASVGLKYEVRRWMDVGLIYQYSNQDSPVATQEFTRNKMLLSVALSL